MEKKRGAGGSDLFWRGRCTVAGQELAGSWRRPLLLSASLLLAAASFLLLASPASAALSDAPDSTPQTDGVVFSVLPVGDRVYIAGDFTQVDGVPRANLAAIDASTGDLTSWNPGANRRVASLAASADGSRIYAGGAFTSIGGISRNRIAALNASTGAVETGFRAGANSAVHTLAVLGNNVYLGGDFTSVKGQTRARLARLDGSTGGLAPWNPAANNRVRALTFSPDGSRLYAGGNFTAVSGVDRSRVAALDPVTGSLDSWSTAVATNGPVFALAASVTSVYTAEGGPGGAAASYDAVSGDRTWRLSGNGDAQAITLLGGKVYIGGHFLKLSGQDRRFFAAADAGTGRLDPDWTPSGGGGKLTDPYTTGVWSLVPDAAQSRLYAGTNFAEVSGRLQRGFIQFSNTIS